MSSRRPLEWPPPLRRYLGALGLIVAVAVIAYFAFAQSIPFVEGYRVQAVFESSSGLRKGSPVRVAGVDVGKVVEIGKGPGHTTLVTLTIDEDGRPLHRDATAHIRPRVFLEGGYQIELRSGSPSAPELPDDGVIPLGQTARPVQFHDLLTAFDRPARDDVKSTMRTFADALDDGGAQGLRTLAPELRPLLRDLAVVRRSRPRCAASTRSSRRCPGPPARSTARCRRWNGPRAWCRPRWTSRRARSASSRARCATSARWWPPAPAIAPSRASRPRSSTYRT